MRSTIALCILLGSFFLLPAVPVAHAGFILHGDAWFVKDAAMMGMFEVKAGQLAAGNGTASQIKELGNMMVTEHTKANNELMELAKSKNIMTPADMGADYQKKYDELANKKAADFDKAYADLMVSSHRKAITKFEKASKKCEDADLKSWAAGKLPSLKHHLQMSEDAQKAVKNNGNMAKTQK